MFVALSPLSHIFPYIPIPIHTWPGMYVRHAAFIQNADCFDAMLFGISGAEVRRGWGMDSTSLLGKFCDTVAVFGYLFDIDVNLRGFKSRRRDECESVDYVHETCFEAWIKMLQFKTCFFHQLCFTYWSM